MSRNGSGTYTAPSGAWNPAINGNSATAADWNALLADLAAAMTQSVSADGQTTITGNLNMGNNKLSSLAAGNASGQSLAWQQLFSQGTESDLASATTTDIGAQNTNFLRITGTTTITSFGVNYNGPRFLRFSGALTLTHNASTLILPNGVNITTSAGDTCIAVPISGGWYVSAYTNIATPPGMVAYFAMSAPQIGWLPADGSAISRTTYAALFATIGTTFGVGNGTTTFNIPDLRGEFLRGFDNGRGVDPGRVFGSWQDSTKIRDFALDFPPIFTVVTGPDSSVSLGLSGGFPTSAGSTGVANATSYGIKTRNVALLACIKY